ncbi:MAG: TraM recognition domain-containing protein, partial [Pseudobdellovibrionaceae bacterium]
KALQGLKSQLESLLLSDFGHLLRAFDGGIDLFAAIRRQKIVYLLLDSRTYGESSRALGKLILQDLKAASARVDNEIPKQERKPFAVIVDEFADMATEDFVGFLDRARSSKVGVVVAHQEIADLSRVSPEFALRLMNSTSTLFAFLQKMPDSSELIAGVAGTRKTREVTEQAETDWLFGERKTGMKSIKEVDEFVIHPNVIRSLNVGECVMVQKYPSSKSAVVRVKPEANNYLTNKEVLDTLRVMKDQYKLCDGQKAVARMPTQVSGAELREPPEGYWQDGV